MFVLFALHFPSIFSLLLFCFSFLCVLILYLIVWFHFRVLLFVWLFSCFLYSLFLFLYVWGFLVCFCLFFLLQFVWGFVCLFGCLFLIVVVAVCLFLSLILVLGCFVCLFLFVFFLHFFPWFLLGRVAFRVLVPRPGVRPEPLVWEHWVQDAGMPENSQQQVILYEESSPRGLHLNSKTQIHPTVCRLKCWTSHAKQQVRQEHKPTHQQIGCLKSY